MRAIRRATITTFRMQRRLYSASMGHVRSALVRACAIVGCVLAAGTILACARGDTGARQHRGRLIAASRSPAPAADFLISAGDSTFWVTSGTKGIRLRGSPLTLAHFGGRFYEVYLADDDRSYYDAVFTGQRIFRRDIERGDSVAVFEDTAVAAAARAYALAHPAESPLEPDQDAADNPMLSVTGEIDLLDSFGPYLSYEYHGSRGGHPANVPRDTTRSGESATRGVIDLEAGAAATVQTIFGRHAGDSVIALGRLAYAATLDSIRAREALADDRARLAARSLSDFVFAPASFVLTDVEREPAVAFFVPGRGRQGGRSLGLPSIRATEPEWWAGERTLLPGTGHGTGADAGADLWRHALVVVRARYDTAGAAYLSLTDGTHREWPIGVLPAPIRRVYWLDDPAIGPVTRRALARAFDESALYSDDARAARRIAHARRPFARFAAARQ
jgi:hypothetical protein